MGIFTGCVSFTEGSWLIFWANLLSPHLIHGDFLSPEVSNNLDLLACSKQTYFPFNGGEFTGDLLVGG